MIETVRNTIDNGNYGCGIFIDLKMEHHGVRGIALNWFASYLTNRKQYVSVNGYVPDYLEISYGVHQGSMLGPLLFLVCINDLTNVGKFLSFYLFLDDTNIYFDASDTIAKNYESGTLTCQKMA